MSAWDELVGQPHRLTEPQRCVSAVHVGDYHGVPLVVRCEREEGHPGAHESDGDPRGARVWPADQ